MFEDFFKLTVPPLPYTTQVGSRTRVRVRVRVRAGGLGLGLGIRGRD